MPSKNIMQLRKTNLAALIKQRGGPTALARQLKHSGPSYLSQLLSANRPITEKTARSIEKQLDLAAEWLDRDHTGREPQLDQTLTTKVLLAVGAALEEQGLQISPSKFAEVVAWVYGESAKRGEIDESLILRLIRLAK